MRALQEPVGSPTPPSGYYARRSDQYVIEAKRDEMTRTCAGKANIILWTAPEM